MARTVALAGVLAAAAVGQASVASDGTYATSVPRLETIRVALYLESDQAFRDTVPTVTLSHPAGLDVGIRLPAGARSWWQTSGPVRFSLDGYRAVLAETTDAAKARALVDSFAGKPDRALSWTFERSGRTVHQVWIGPYATREQAEAKLAQYRGDPALVQAAGGGTAALRIAGPHRLSAGTYATEAEAARQVKLLADKGLTAGVALVDGDDGRPAWEAWIGEEADAASVERLKADAGRLLPGVTLQPADLSRAYFVRRGGPAGSGVAAHLAMNAGAVSQKAWVSAASPGIRVEEKDRSYRGSFELSAIGGKLALVNELPLEAYLYSVVGSEAGAGWPAEALKAQAVAARTIALGRGLKYKIAHISDSTYDQAYYGIDRETPVAVAAVDATRGEVLVRDGRLIEPLFHSNAGGMTADPAEVWNAAVDYLRPVASPDETAAAGKPVWYKVQLANGEVGHVHSDLLKDTGQRRAGLPVLEAKETGVRVRPVPLASDAVAPRIAELQPGQPVVKLGETVESNAYSWMRGPYRADQLLERLRETANGTFAGPLRTLEVAKTGPSGRVTEVRANGVPVTVSKADNYRTVFFSLPSANFRIEETGRYRILGANGRTRDLYGSGDERVHAVGAGGKPVELTGPTRIVTDGRTIRAGTKDARFVFHGKGFGHGLGMSQWGAKGLADQGYDYQRILRYYYHGATILKDGA